MFAGHIVLDIELDLFKVVNKGTRTVLYDITTFIMLVQCFFQTLNLYFSAGFDPLTFSWCFKFWALKKLFSSFLTSDAYFD